MTEPPMIPARALSMPDGTPRSKAAALMRWSCIAMVAVSWISAASFGLYIIAFYRGNIPAGRLEDWNRNLSGLYTRGAVATSSAIAAHFATGAIILALGP